MAAAHPRTPPVPVEWVNLDELLDADRNPRIHDVEAVAGSIRRWGYVDHGVLDRRTGQMIGGHGRAKALRWLRDRGELPANWDCERPNVHVDSSGAWWVPTATTTTADPEDAAALLVALNPDRPDRSGWDTAGLATLLDDLRGAPGGLVGTGYDDAAVDGLLASIAGDTPTTDLPEGGTEPGLGENTEFRVMVTCSNEDIQASLAEELEQRGYTVQLQMS